MQIDKNFSTAIISRNRTLPQGDPQVCELPPLQRQKPQISSIPGVSAKEKNRYRVTLGGVILGAQLTSQEAYLLAQGREG